MRAAQASRSPGGMFYGSNANFHPLPQVPLLTTWKGRLCACLNVTSEAALSWYLARARRLRQALGAAYVAFEGAEGNAFLRQAVPPPAELAGDRYTGALAAALATLGNATVISAGARWVPGRRRFAGGDGGVSCLRYGSGDASDMALGWRDSAQHPGEQRGGGPGQYVRRGRSHITSPSLL